MDGLLIDWGGVLTTSMMASFDAFSVREGLGEHAVRRAFRDDPAARGALIELECGRIDLPAFEARLAATLGVPAGGLARRLTADVRPDASMLSAVRRFHEAGIRTALVSNSWAREDYSPDLGVLFDVVLLSGELGIRKPDPAIYELALRELGLPADRCVFVDDLGGNLKPAKALGMATIRHESAETTLAELARLLSSSPS
jgi:putative hydrolase of the HAD superfamily